MKTEGAEKLVFIYNAGSDVFSKVTDFAHKILFPKTYDCQLCSITYGNFSMEKEWKNFISDLPLLVEFRYKDESQALYPDIKNFPVVIIDNGTEINILITPQEINNCENLDDLQTLISERLKRPK